MTAPQSTRTLQALTTPRAAAVAGILFALLYTAGLVLIRSAIPAESTSASGAWLETSVTRVSLGLNLVPFAGIAFLWFIGVVRDRLGDLEDRLFATVVLGSGLLFLAMTFAGAALAGGLLSTYALGSTSILENGIFTYGREVTFQLINVYAVRMAGLFMISLGSIWIRTGAMHRAWAFVTYALALVLLVSVTFSLWVTLVFPAWVFAVSVQFLIRSRHANSADQSPAGGAA